MKHKKGEHRLEQIEFNLMQISQETCLFLGYTGYKLERILHHEFISLKFLFLINPELEDCDGIKILFRSAK